MTIPQENPTSSSDSPPPNRQERRGLKLWMAVLAVVFLSLVCCGQVAVMVQTRVKPVNSASLLKADYQPWSDERLPEINSAAMLEDVQREEMLLGTPPAFPEGTVEVGNFWLGTTATPVVISELATLTPTPTATEVPPSATPTPDIPSQTPTNVTTPTHTRTPTWTETVTPSPTSTVRVIYVTWTFTPEPEEPSLTPPPVIPSVTPSFTPTQTIEPSFTPTFTFTPTHTPVIPTWTPPPPTITPTETPVLPPTRIPTHTLIPTLAPVRPIAENGGQSFPNGAGGCVAHFGYRNDNPFTVSIPVGDENRLDINDGAQVTDFAVGRKVNAFEVTWDTPSSITWTVQGRSATVDWCNP